MFAVVDFETTGQRPGRDQVVEIAVVTVDEFGTVMDEWSTLVKPAVAMSGGGVHGVFKADVRYAPSFADVAGDLLGRLDANVPVAHNARFDSAFLDAEFGRLGQTFPCQWLCTLELAGRLDFSWSRSLRACCANLGVPHDNGHSALVDAQATARLLSFLSAVAYERGVSLHLPPPLLLEATPPASGRSLHRRTPEPGQDPPLRRLVSRMPGLAVPADIDQAAGLAYEELLDRVLEDRLIAPDEALALCELAASWGLSMADLGRIHRAYVSSLADVAIADGVISRREQQDLGTVADLVGVRRADVLDDLIEKI